MDDIDQILYAHLQLREAGRRAVLATLVSVKGATFRKIGARMLIDEKGGTVGAITAGCIESDIVEKAQKVLSTGSPLLVNYDTGSEKEIFFGWGSGCDGVLQVLIEPIDGMSAIGVLPYLAKCRQDRIVADITTIYDISGSATEYYVGQHFYGRDNPICPQLANRGNVGSSSLTVETSGVTLSILTEEIIPQQKLVIFGGGAVSEPLSRFAVETGWDVTVVDKRPAFSAPEKFADHAQVVCLPYEAVSEHVTFDSHTAVVITTHNFLDDVFLIGLAAKSEARTVSVLSSRRRASRLVEAVETSIGPLSTAEIEKIYAPAGLDIGGDTPAVIALSIAAQLVQIFSGGHGGSIRDKRSEPLLNSI